MPSSVSETNLSGNRRARAKQARSFDEADVTARPNPTADGRSNGSAVKRMNIGNQRGVNVNFTQVGFLTTPMCTALNRPLICLVGILNR